MFTLADNVAVTVSFLGDAVATPVQALHGTLDTTLTVTVAAAVLDLLLLLLAFTLTFSSFFFAFSCDT